MAPEPDLQVRPVLAGRTRLQVDAVSGEPLLLSPEGLLILNDTAHAIVRRCTGAFSIAAILEQLAEEYGIKVEDLQADVLLWLRELRQRQLVTF
jgi:pyrroloquinoline quinone biosynthesis protein D